MSSQIVLAFLEIFAVFSVGWLAHHLNYIHADSIRPVVQKHGLDGSQKIHNHLAP